MTAGAERRARLAATQLYLVASLPAGLEGAPAERDALLRRIAQAAAAGARLVQLRLKQGSTADRRALLERLRPLLPHDALLLINDDLEAVCAADGRTLADGAHLGREDAAALAPTSPLEPTGVAASASRIAQGLAQARRVLGPELLLGTSTRTQDEVAAARAAGADYAGFGAMAHSPTKSDTVRADPTELRRCLAAFPDFPLFPIGGLGPGRLAVVRAAGGRRAAVGSAILQAGDPADVVRACLRQLAD